MMVRREDVVAAVLPMQEHWLPQSNLDLLLPPVDVGVFFCYKRPSTVGENQAQAQFGSMVGILKNALAQALVSYYVFGGEIVHNSVGEPELLCNNRGVDFMEAYADVEIQGLNFYNPDESIEGKLVPKKKKGVLCVQVYCSLSLFLSLSYFGYIGGRSLGDGIMSVNLTRTVRLRRSYRES